MTGRVGASGRTQSKARPHGGSRSSDAPAVHLLAALEHGDAVVLGQGVVDGKSNEITAFAALLDGIDITGVIVTADALHTVRHEVASERVAIREGGGWCRPGGKPLQA